MDWFQMLSEPIRIRLGQLTAPQRAFFSLTLNFVGIRIAAAEASDVASFSVQINIPHKRAKVAITEISPPSNVAMNEIKYTRGYS